MTLKEAVQADAVQDSPFDGSVTFTTGPTRGAIGDSPPAAHDVDPRAGRELAATVSHDLRNRLTALKGRVQLLRRGLTDPNGPDLERLSDGLARIERTASAMTAMLDELIDVSFTEGATSSAPIRRPTDLVLLARRVAADYQQLTDRHQIRVRATAAAIVGSWDPSRLERVVVNLVSNAIKYSPEGGEIDLTAAWDDATNPPGAVLRVRDRGIGIPSADLPRIFEGFHRAENAIGRAPGTGVGLMAVRQIVEEHGGTVTVRSREGHWSTFTVRLPLFARPTDCCGDKGAGWTD